MKLVVMSRTEVRMLCVEVELHHLYLLDSFQHALPYNLMVINVFLAFYSIPIT